MSSYWVCKACALTNSHLRQLCQACFMECPSSNTTNLTTSHAQQTEAKSYDHLNKYELTLLISGFARIISSLSHIIPQEIINSISLYHWSKLYEDFNSFTFKKDDDLTIPCQNFERFKYCIIPLNELKQHYLLPFNEIIFDENKNVKIGKYSSFDSNYCPEFIKEKDCMIHQVILDKNNENIYHLLDSFVVNKFIELFGDIEPMIGPHKSLPAGKGPFRSGFRCVGSIKKMSKPDLAWFNERIKYNKLWKFIGGNFDILILDKKEFVEKCLMKQFDINLDFDENEQIDRDKFKQYDKTNSNDMNDNEIIHLLYTIFATEWRDEDQVDFTGIMDQFCEFRHPEMEKCVFHLNCKQLVCQMLYGKVTEILDENHWIRKKLIEWKLKLNVDEEMKIAIEKEEKKKKENNDDDDDEDVILEDDNHLNGRWSSWNEIEIKNNEIEQDVYPILMTDIVFSTHYRYHGMSVSTSRSDVVCWDIQRVMFGNKFLELFNKHDRNNKIRAFWCEHPGWDMFSENSLCANRMLCCIDNEKIVAVWSLIHRLYG